MKLGGNIEMSTESYLAFQLAMSDQLLDLQRNGKTYTIRTKDGVDVPVGHIYHRAYMNVLKLLSKVQRDPTIRLGTYNGNWYTKVELDKMLHRDIF